MVAAGRLAVAFTDTDDAIIEQEAGKPVRIVFPDIEPNGIGTLLLPNTLALIKGGPHSQAGRRLIDYLLTREVEERLARSASAQIPLHGAAHGGSRIGGLDTIAPMRVDFQSAADAFAEAAAYIEGSFLH